MKTVLITGSSRGIGRETALFFGKKGYSVAVHGCSHPKQAEQTAMRIRQNGGSAMAFIADIAQKQNVTRLFSQIEKHLGTVDILINNAALSSSQLFTDLIEEDWDRLYRINVNGALFCSQLSLKRMLPKHTGKIINLSSIWGITGASCEVAYSTTKAALIGFTKALAKEVGPSGIQVNCVAPGVIDTDMNRSLSEEDRGALKEQTPLGRLGSPKEIAEVIFFLASTQSDFITGQIISPNGGMVI